jgi:hypothetical protein
MFAEAINSQAHLEQFISLANSISAGRLNLESSKVQIQENIRWIELKAPEIENWLKSEAGKLNFSFMASFATSILVLSLHFLKK